MKRGGNKFIFSVIIIFGILLIATSFISATSNGKGLVPETVITGTVTSAEDGESVVGADITIKCGLALSRTTTDSDGNYYFDLLKKKCKKHDEATVMAEMDGIKAYNTEIIEGKETSIDILFGESDELGTIVTGVIYEGSNLESPIEGAHVTVICGEGEEETDSLSDGTYFVFFDQEICDDGDTAIVTAESDGLSGSNSGIVHGSAIEGLDVAVVNVPLVPEFGPVIGVLTALAAVGVFFIVRRK